MPSSPSTPSSATSSVPADLAIVNARLAGCTGIVDGGLEIRAGRVAAVLERGAQAHAKRVIDAHGHYVLPGVVDAHVHFRTPGLTHKEDWEHGSRAAAAGGVTSVIDMPNTDPPLLGFEDCERRARLVAGHSLVDFRFHPGAEENSVDLSDAGASADVVSVKVFMAGHHTARHVVRDHAALERLFARAAQERLVVLAHAEDDGVFALLDAARSAQAEHLSFERVRPRSGAIAAVIRVLELVRRYGTRLHVLHVSSAEEVELLDAAATVGLPVSFEVTAHHLTFTSEEVERVGPRLWLSPAIRGVEDRERLWAALIGGSVATVGSDHAPHTSSEKARPGLAAPPGLPGVQELLAAVHTGLVRRLAAPDARMALIARVLAANPAELFALGGRKGRLQPGYDADLVVFDPRMEWTVADADAHSLCRWSAYCGQRMIGKPLLTVRRGEVIWDASTGSFGEPDGVYLAVERARSPQAALRQP